MRYLSVCSGIEAATVAWHPLGWEAAAYSEIEKFPSQVLAHHYPNTPNVGDMTKFKEWTNVSDVNVLVGGTPCQSFSVAGLRKGLDDPRGNLMLTYLAIAAKYRPKWLVWENVPGVLSSNGGLDFASLLRGMGELGYGFAYRILDAQYFGVAQRRRRVFVVGYAGNWRPAAAVLFERHSLCGYPAPSREKGKSVARSAAHGLDVSCIGTLTAGFGKLGAPEIDAYTAIPARRWPADVASTLDTHFGDKQGLEDQHVNAGCPLFVPAPLFVTSGQANAAFSQNVGLALNSTNEPPYVVQPIPIHDQATRYAGTDGSGNQNGKGHGLGIGGETDPMFTLTKGDKHAVAQPIAFEPGKMKRLGRGDAEAGLTPTLRANAGDNQLAVAVGTDLYNGNITGDVAATMGTPGSSSNASGPTVMQAMQVRRLTPVECERLQGFPDNYTDIKSKGKPTPDGPRYKALGNSMAVPVMAWIGKRIQEVEAINAP